MTRRCALYLRISLDHTGEGLAIARQREDCLAIVKQRGWEVVREYSESVSASSKHKVRPAYGQLVEDYRDGQFDAIVTWDLDRLTRQPTELEQWIDAAEERGLVVVTANGEADLSTDAGRLFARIKAAVSRSEIERKGARQKRAALQRAQRGKTPLGVRLTGYTIDGETIPAEAEVVKAVFNMFVSGESLHSIVVQMNLAGIPTRHGNRWHPNSIRRILTNPRYAGHAVYRGEQIEAEVEWESFIDPETFALVQAKLNDPRRITNRSGTDRKHLGGGLYLCGLCGHPTRSWSNRRYRCPKGCMSRSGKPVDELVEAVMMERLSRPDVRDLLKSDDSEVTDLNKQATALRHRLELIGNDYDSGLIDGKRYRIASDKVNAELESLERQIGARSGASAIVGILQAPSPSDEFANASLMRKRAVIETLCTVRLLRCPIGVHAFDPETVVIEWKGSEQTAQAS
jgi:DNA invertase Pin-like site-specific DNA recombinase